MAAANISGEEMIGYLIGVVCVVAWVVGWHRRQRAAKNPGMASVLFISLAFLVALIFAGLGAYGIGIRSSAVEAKAGGQADVTKHEQLLKDPYVDLSTVGRLSLQGRFTRPDGPVTIYVTYGAAPGGIINPNPVIGGKLAVEPRIKISAIDHFDRNEQANVTIGSVASVEGNQQVIQWGEQAQKNTRVGITWASYFGFVIFVWKDGKEESYPFSIVSRSVGSDAAAPPIFIGPDILSAYSAISPNAQKN